MARLYSLHCNLMGSSSIAVALKSSRNQKPEALTKTRIPLKVQGSTGGIPQAVLLSGQWVNITSVVRHWDVSETISGEKRMIKSYFEIVTEKGTPLTLFRNQVTGSWYREDFADKV